MLLRLIVVGLLSLAFIEVQGMEKEEVSDQNRITQLCSSLKSLIVKEPEVKKKKIRYLDCQCSTTVSSELEELNVIRSITSSPVRIFKDEVIPFVLKRKGNIDILSLDSEENKKLKSSIFESSILDMIKVSKGKINFKKRWFELTFERMVYDTQEKKLVLIEKMVEREKLNNPLEIMVYGIGCECDDRCSHCLKLSILIEYSN